LFDPARLKITAQNVQFRYPRLNSHLIIRRTETNNHSLMKENRLLNGKK